MKLPLEQNFLVIGAAGLVGAIALAFIDHRRSASAPHVETLREQDATQQANAIVAHA